MKHKTYFEDFESREEYELAKRDLYVNVLVGGALLSEAKGALGVVRLMGEAGSGFGIGFAEALEELSGVDEQGAEAYLTVVPHSDRARAFEELGLAPELQRVIAYLQGHEVRVSGLWVKEDQGVLRVSCASDVQAVWCPVDHESRPESQGLDTAVGFGYCYLSMVLDRYLVKVKAQLGPAPTFAQVMSLPVEYFVHDWESLELTAYGHVYHVSSRRGAGLHGIMQSVARRGHWPAGSLGSQLVDQDSGPAPSGSLASGEKVPGLCDVLAGSDPEVGTGASSKVIEKFRTLADAIFTAEDERCFDNVGWTGDISRVTADQLVITIPRKGLKLSGDFVVGTDVKKFVLSCHFYQEVQLADFMRFLAKWPEKHKCKAPIMLRLRKGKLVEITAGDWRPEYLNQFVPRPGDSGRVQEITDT